MTTPRARLMIPGPVDVEDDVLAAMSEQTWPHYGRGWLDVYNPVVDGLKRVFGTHDDLLILPGPGSAGLDAALGSLMRTGDRVLVLSNGFFGRRLAAMAQAYGLDVQLLALPVDRPLEPDAVRRFLAGEHDLGAAAFVHLETSTGVLNPARDIAAVLGEFGVPVILDAVSSLGGVPLLVDDWGIDICVGVANKCLASPPGVAFVTVSPRAWDQIERTGDRAHGWFLNLGVWRDYSRRWGSWHPTPTTLPTNNIVALSVSLRHLLAEGLEARCAHYARVAQTVRAGLYRHGFALYTDEAFTSPLITAVRGLPGMDVEDLRRYLLDEWQIMVSGGLEELRGHIFRLGHIGKASTAEYTERFLAGVDAYLRH